VLLGLAQSHKLYTMKSAFKHDIGSHNSVLVTAEEIEIMGETLKMVVFFVSPFIMQSTVELARSKGVLIKSAWGV
jgi:hypothetical protein